MDNRGGARNRSGPQKDPNSGRGEKLAWTTLPSEGYDGPVPDWPLPDLSDREQVVWSEAWSLPQAAAWAVEEWRHRTVAMWVRYTVRAEDKEAPASLLPQVIRLGDQVGLTPAGLRENGWKIVDDEVAQRATSKVPARPVVVNPRDRLRVADAPGG